MTMFRRAWAAWAIVLYGLVLAGTAAVGTAERPVPAPPVANLLDKPLGEDGFYMLSVARSLAAGDAFTYGGVPTTGVQPLATVCFAALYWLSDAMVLPDDAPLRLVIVLNVLILVTVGALSGRLVESQLRAAGHAGSYASWIVPVLVVANPAAFRLFTYGLETGMYLACMVLVQLAMVQGRPAALVGALCGVCFLARVDFAILACVVVGLGLMAGRFRAIDVATMAIVAAIVASPWLWHVYRLTGGFMPSSGASQAGGIASLAELATRTWAMASAAIIAMSGVFYLPIQDRSTQIAVVVSLVIVIGAAVRFARGELAVLLTTQWPWLAGAGALAVYYLLASYAVHFYPRYLAPFWLVCVQLVGGTLAVLAARQRLPWRALRALPATLVALFAVQIGYTVHRGAVSNTHLLTGFYILRNQNELGVVGAFQSGLVGYMTGERTVNLDGKLDGRALAWRDDLHLECYLAERGVTTVIDWDVNIHNGWIDRRFVETRMREIDRVPPGASVVMRVDSQGVACPGNP